MRRHKILVRGPALSASGYGEQTRFALQCLKSREDIFDIFLIPINWGKTGWISHLNQERAWLDHLIMKTTFHVQNKGQFDISLQVTIPNEWEKLAPLNVGYTAGVETTLVAPQWVEKSALMDRIITTSKHAKDTLLNTSYEATNKETGQTVPDYRVQTPTQEVNYCVRYNEPQKLDIELETDFNFLTVAQWGPRKNLGNTVRWFVEEFKNEENVGLVVKTNLMKNCIIDRGIMKDRLSAFLSEYPDRKCKVYLLHGNLSDGEMSSLYLHPKISGLLALTHGEGFGLPIFEAVCNGLPVVACDWSGQVDFLHGRVKEKSGKFKKRALFTKVDYELVEIPDEAVWDGVLQKGSRWCNASEKDAKRKLRDFYKNPTVPSGKARKLKDYVLRQFAPEKKHAEFVEQVLLAGLPSLPAEDESVMVFD